MFINAILSLAISTGCAMAYSEPEWEPGHYARTTLMKFITIKFT